MRSAIMTAIASLLLVSTATLSTPAAATDAKQAISMCAARSNPGSGQPAGNTTLIAHSHHK